MADKDLEQGQQLLASDKTRYQEIASGVYARVMAIAGAFGAFVQDFTGALVGINYPHHEIHGGSTFFVSYKNPDGSLIADNATISFTITTRGKYAHMIFRAAGGGDMEVELLEGSTVTGGTGVATVVYNKNRASTKANTVGVRRDMTVTVDWTRLEDELVPGGTGGNAIGGANAERPEWVLALNTVYVFRITNRAGNAQPMSLAVEWYEESENN